MPYLPVSTWISSPGNLSRTDQVSQSCSRMQLEEVVVLFHAFIQYLRVSAFVQDARGPGSIPFLAWENSNSYVSKETTITTGLCAVWKKALSTPPFKSYSAITGKNSRFTGSENKCMKGIVTSYLVVRPFTWEGGEWVSMSMYAI